MEALTDRQLETLQAVEVHANRATLNNNDIEVLLGKGLIFTAWSEYGLKVSAEGVAVLDGL